MMRVPILTYHAIEAGSGPLFTAPAQFAAQMAVLARSGYQAIGFQRLLSWLQEQQPLPDKPIIITFDDGYASVFHEAWPILRNLNFTPIIFLVSGYCGRDNQWPGQPAWVPRRPLLSWDEILRMQDGSCEFGAHTHTHPVLTSLSPDEIAREIQHSRAFLDERLGSSPESFAYPYGAVNSAVIEQVRNWHAVGVTTRLGMVTARSNPHLLERIDAYYLTEGWLSRLGSPLFRAYLEVIKGLQRAKRLAKGAAR